MVYVVARALVCAWMVIATVSLFPSRLPFFRIAAATARWLHKRTLLRTNDELWAEGKIHEAAGEPLSNVSSAVRSSSGPKNPRGWCRIGLRQVFLCVCGATKGGAPRCGSLWVVEYGIIIRDAKWGDWQ